MPTPTRAPAALFANLAPALTIAALALAPSLVPSLAPAQEVTPLEVAEGVVVLPVSGLEISLPAAPAGCRYLVTGAWALGEGESFNGHDEIATMCGDSLVANDLVWMGFFGDDVGKALIGNLQIADAWEDHITLWDSSTRPVRGGMMELEGRGTTPMAAIGIYYGERTIIVEHFWTNEAGRPPRAITIDEVRSLDVPSAVAANRETFELVPAQPTHLANVANTGALAATRTALLPNLGRKITFPDDGYVWLVLGGDPEAPADVIERRAPFTPWLRLEINYFWGHTGKSLVASMNAKRIDERVWSLPDGWEAQPTLEIDGVRRLLVTRDDMNGVTAVSIHLGTYNRDMTGLHPILEAIFQAMMTRE